MALLSEYMMEKEASAASRYVSKMKKLNPVSGRFAQQNVARRKMVMENRRKNPMWAEQDTSLLRANRRDRRADTRNARAAHANYVGRLEGLANRGNSAARRELARIRGQ